MGIFLYRFYFEGVLLVIKTRSFKGYIILWIFRYGFLSRKKYFRY